MAPPLLRPPLHTLTPLPHHTALHNTIFISHCIPNTAQCTPYYIRPFYQGAHLEGAQRNLWIFHVALSLGSIHVLIGRTFHQLYDFWQLKMGFNKMKVIVSFDIVVLALAHNTASAKAPYSTQTLPYPTELNHTMPRASAFPSPTCWWWPLTVSHTSVLNEQCLSQCTPACILRRTNISTNTKL